MRYFEEDGIIGSRTVPDYFNDYTYQTRMEEYGAYDRMRSTGKHVVLQQITQPHHNDVLMGRGGEFTLDVRVPWSSRDGRSLCSVDRKEQPTFG